MSELRVPALSGRAGLALKVFMLWVLACTDRPQGLCGGVSVSPAFVFISFMV